MIIVPIVCHRCFLHGWQIGSRRHWYRWQFATGINNTRKTGGSICCRCCLNWWQICSHLTCEYLCKFSNKFETFLLEYSGAGGKLIHEKNQKQKISWHRPYKMGQMLKEFREKRENIIPLKVGRNNKMATGGRPSTQRLRKDSSHPLIPPYSPFFLSKLSVRKPYFKWYPICSLKVVVLSSPLLPLLSVVMCTSFLVKHFRA